MTAAVRSLGYVGYEARDLAAWNRFLGEVFALQRRADSPAGSSQFRIDDRHHRISVHAGAGDRIGYMGWEMSSREALASLQARLGELGVAVEQGSPALAAERAVLELIAFENPDGVRQEAYFGLGIDDTAYLPTRPIAGYLTGEFGLGHIALLTRDHHAAAAWYRDVLGFRLSDVIETGPLRSSFMHCNGRHHSIALINEIPGLFDAGGIHHLMLEAVSLEDVGRAYDLVLERGYPLAHTLGQHANDRMTSFYAFTPSGSQIEYGYGGVVVDAGTWTAKFFNSGDLWGHKMQPPPSQWPSAVE